MKRNAFSIVELLVVIGILAILLALLLPALRINRDGISHRITCQNNLRQIALAMTNYHSAQQCFPPCFGSVGGQGAGSSGQLGPFVAILPFMDESSKFDSITKGYTDGGASFPAFPALSDVNFEPWQTGSPIFICPNVPEDKVSTDFAKTHYGICIGDRARNIHSPETARGPFSGSRRISYADILDGSSNTFMVGEIGARTKAARANQYAINQPVSILENPSQCYGLVDGNGQDWQFKKSVSLSKIGRGGHWADGRAGVALFNTILAPMSPSVSEGEIGGDGIYSASGPHEGGVNIARMDGSVAFIVSEIDAGDSSTPAPTEEEMAAGIESPYGVWGALGTINGGETVTDYY